MDSPVQDKNPLLGLLGLPAELQEQILVQLYHLPVKEQRPCEVSDTRLGDLGCRCGEGLSATCRQLYQCTRNRYFNCARFVFKSPRSCERYLHDIGEIRNQIGSLELAYTNTVEESNLLSVVFNYLKESQRLCHLELIAHARDGQPELGFPMYMPDQVAYNEAQLWDILHRPISHPLANLKAVQKLSIAGHPVMDEVEEALFKARKNVVDTVRYQLEETAISVSSWNTRLNLINFVVGTVPDEVWMNWPREYH